MKIRGNHKTCVALLLDLRLLERVADAGPHQSQLRNVLAVPPVPATRRRPRGLPQSHQIHLDNRYNRYARYTVVCNPSDPQCDIMSDCPLATDLDSEIFYQEFPRHAAHRVESVVRVGVGRARLQPASCGMNDTL